MKISTSDRDPDLAKHSQGAPASGVSVGDADDNFVADNVEDALAELVAVLNGLDDPPTDRALGGSAVSRGNPPPWEPGAFTAGGSPVSVSAGTDSRAFPGLAWLDGEGTVGGRVLLVYRHGATHLLSGKIVGMIGTVTDDDPWTFSWSAEFDIEDLANDLRCEDAVSVIDDTIYVAAREYNGSANILPHILVCDDPASSFTSSSTWTRYEGPTWNGTQENFTQGRVLKLTNGTWLVGIGKKTAGTFSVGCAIVSDPTDWSAPTFVTIASSRSEICINQLADGTLRAHLNPQDGPHTKSTSTNYGLTWTAVSSLYSAAGFPTFRESSTGLMLAVHRDEPFGDTVWRQSDDGAITWSSETVLDTTSHHSTYAALLQLDDLHWLCVYATEDAANTDSDLWSQIFTDSSIPGWNQAEPNVNDGDDATYEEIDGADVLIIDLGAEYRITATRLLIGTATAGAKTYVITGSVDPDFDPDLSEVLATLNFTATGSFTADEVEASWAAGVMYRYFKLTGDDENRRIFTWELLQEPFSISIDHDDLGNVTADQHHAQEHGLTGADHTMAGLTVGHVLTATSATAAAFQAPTGDPSADTHVWMPLTTRVGGDLVIVADGDDGGLIPTLTPL